MGCSQSTVDIICVVFAITTDFEPVLRRNLFNHLMPLLTVLFVITFVALPYTYGFYSVLRGRDIKFRCVDGIGAEASALQTSA